MKQKIQSIISHPLISGSSIIFIGFFIANILNFIFSIVMIHLLSKSDYGILITLASIFVLLGVFQQSLQSSFAKFAAVFLAKNDPGSLHSLILLGLKVVLYFAGAILFIFFILTPVLTSYLH